MNSITRAAVRITKWLSAVPAAWQTIACMLVIAAVAGAVAIPYCVKLESNNDDVNWVARSLSPWWFPYPAKPIPNWSDEYRVHYHDQRWTSSAAREYYYAIDHPPVARMVYREALHCIGVRSLNRAAWDYSISHDENRRLGHYVPDNVKVALRMVNFAFIVGALWLAYFGINRVAGSRFLSVVAVLFLIAEPELLHTQLSVVTYIGADSVFMFLYAAVWLAWLRLRQPTLRNAVYLGVLAGLATSTKVNGSFLVIGIAAYFALYGAGWRKAAAPVATCLTAAAVYLLLNPVYFGDGFSWAFNVFRDTIDLRYYVKASRFVSSPETLLGKLNVTLIVFPYVWLILPVIAVIWPCRQEWWFPVTFLWSTSLVVLNVAFVYATVPRYAAPARVAFLVIFLACGASLAHSALATWLRVGPSRPLEEAGAEAIPFRGGRHTT